MEVRLTLLRGDAADELGWSFGCLRAVSVGGEASVLVYFH